ncbi:MAG: SGNH/GDSL hydrolase family protein [Thermoanaerobaculia bacterium]
MRESPTILMRKKLALSAASILITLLFVEIALRILGIGAAGRGSAWFAGGNHPRFLFQPDPASGYTLRPGFQGREIAQSKEFDVPVAIDGQGLRAQPHAAPPQPRVLALGDSITFGEGVPADSTYSAVLERALRVRVDNAGVPGYSSAQMLGRLRNSLPLLRPRVVVMTLSPTWDLGRCASPFVYKGGYIVGQGYVDRLLLLDGNLYLRETKLPGLGTATAYAERYSNLARLALPSLANAARKAIHRRPRPGPSTAADVEPTARNLQEAQRLASQSGAAFLAVMVDDRGPAFRHDRGLLQARLRQLGVPWVAADDLIPPARWPRLRYPVDTHWNAAGHQAMGEALAPRVRPLLGRTPPE